MLKEQNACDSTIESIIQSIPVPQALFSSCEQEMPVVSSKMMYEGYANRIITDSILLILYENGVDTAEREVIQNLVEMVKQSICNVGIYLTKTEMHFQTDRDYFQENYEIPKEKVPSTIEQITSIRESTSRSEKRNYSSISSNQSIPIEPIPISIVLLFFNGNFCSRDNLYEFSSFLFKKEFLLIHYFNLCMIDWIITNDCSRLNHMSFHSNFLLFTYYVDIKRF